MATSKDILFWTPRGQLLRKKPLNSVTNIAELVEYVLLPHNDEVIKPRALNTFLDGLVELGVDIKNKKILSDLLEKEKVYRENGEGEGDDDSDRSEGSDSSDGEESQSESNDGESDN